MPAVNKKYCAKHAVVVRERQRARLKNKRRNLGAASYSAEVAAVCVTISELKSTSAKQQTAIAGLKKDFRTTVARQQKKFDSRIAQQQEQIEALTAVLQKVSDQLQLNKPAPQVANNNQ